MSNPKIPSSINKPTALGSFEVLIQHYDPYGHLKGEFDLEDESSKGWKPWVRLEGPGGKIIADYHKLCKLYHTYQEAALAAAEMLRERIHNELMTAEK